MSARRSIRSSVAVLAAWVCAVALLVAAPVALSSSIAPAPAAAAASGSDFNPGNIISDAAFYDSNAMGSPEIQAFMERQVRSCSSGYTCLKDYRQNTDNRPSDRYCNGYEGRGNESASTIIDRVARSCGISQKVILVLLEKEQSLVTSTSPTARAYAAATGQGCPDTAPCDSATLGFFYQVYYAARQYKIYKAFPQDFGYQAGRWNNILYHPYNNCGTQRVYIENQATAGLYIYTPYVPNQAALNNLYGTGDSCSSYGNRNFWRLYTDWFGSTQANPGNPVGNVDEVESRVGGVRLRGWAVDPDTAESIQIHVYVGNVGYVLLANRSRPDVAAAIPGAGAAHGFDDLLPVPPGATTRVCAYAINTAGLGSNTLLSCHDVTPLSGSPIGYVDSVTAVEGGVQVRGWGVDPDTLDNLRLRVTTSQGATVLTANQPRPDLSAVLLAHGTSRGFDSFIPLMPGNQRVCVVALNVGAGSDLDHGCRTVTVPSPTEKGRLPFGALDEVSANSEGIRVRGWAIDPDTVEPIAVHVYVDGRGYSLRADANRPDVGAAHGSYGPRHGFEASFALPGGQHTVCVYAINTLGDNPLLGCRDIQVGNEPIGALDAVVGGPDGVRVRGWAFDPDVPTRPIEVHVYVGNSGFSVRADKTRADVGQAFPQAGSQHGFDSVLKAPRGVVRVCAYAIDTAGGPNPLLGCQSVSVP